MAAARAEGEQGAGRSDGRPGDANARGVRVEDEAGAVVAQRVVYIVGAVGVAIAGEEFKFRREFGRECERCGWCRWQGSRDGR